MIKNNSPRPDDRDADETAPGSGTTGFAAFGLKPELLTAINDLGWENATEIQLEAIPVILSGQDVFGIAQTGTGKTGAFALPVLHKLSELGPAPRLNPYCVILAPTRELCSRSPARWKPWAKV